MNILKKKQVLIVFTALVIAGLGVSLLWPTGQPTALGAGFLTSTTDARRLAHNAQRIAFAGEKDGVVRENII